MASSYFSDHESYVTNQSSATSAEAAYQTISQHSPRDAILHVDLGHASGPFPSESSRGKQSNDDHVDDSLFDPRRFTPTLHASLVSEILSLRRELESKGSLLEELETSHHDLQRENEALAKQMTVATKESRKAKKQLEQLEIGTVSALEGVVDERDRLQDTNTDLRTRLETAQRHVRSQNDESKRMHDMWASEKETWADEKRSFERRVHVSESRLRSILDDFAAAQGAQQQPEDVDLVPDVSTIQAVIESNAGSASSSPQKRPVSQSEMHSRTMSNDSLRSLNHISRMSIISECSVQAKGVSLADELMLDDQDVDLDHLELDSDDYPENEMRARRVLECRQALRPDEKAKRVLGLSSENPHCNQDLSKSSVEADLEPEIESHVTVIDTSARKFSLVFPPAPPEVVTGSAEYVDTGVQPSPPPSPSAPRLSVFSRTNEADLSGVEVEANQSRKRASARFDVPQAEKASWAPLPTASRSCQTVDIPPSPPTTPIARTSEISMAEHHDLNARSTSNPHEMDCLDNVHVIPPRPRRSPPSVPIEIPSIAIHAPTSTPSSPKDPMLPPRTKSIGIQTSLMSAIGTRSVSMQTEPIRIDQRPVKLPYHLLPSSIRSRPSTPEPRPHPQEPTTVLQSPSTDIAAEIPKAAPLDMVAPEQSAPRLPIEDRYPGNNDNGPLAGQGDSILSRPFRTSSLFAGFERPSSDDDDADKEEEAALTADESRTACYATPMLSARAVKKNRLFQSPPTPVPEESETSPAPKHKDAGARSRVPPTERFAPGRSARSSLTRGSSIRKAAMIHSGATMHMRSRSPSASSSLSGPYERKPPFPVPTRSSSRKPPSTQSEESQSPTTRATLNASEWRSHGVRYDHRRDGIRKVRSAVAMPRHPRPRSRSPPLPFSPKLPPTPSMTPTADRFDMQQINHRSRMCSTASHTQCSTTGSTGHDTNVVDAIAISMVGEWMWKYVRKRKAFGGQQSPADLARGGSDSISTANGVRHKRWVWISPYERSVLWSNKQPTSGNALLGKNGRKLIIQSVLDVTDHSPIPRDAGAETLYNRSILILTPARALKFTAISRERHQVWLTALSFLAHAGAPLPELGPSPPMSPPTEEEVQVPPIQAALSRRSHIRDSVRLTKERTNPAASSYRQPGVPVPGSLATGALERPLPASAGLSHGSVSHNRKRSSTGPGAPPPTIPFRHHLRHPVPSMYSTGSSDTYGSMGPPSVPSSVYNPHSTIPSSRTSNASTTTRQQFMDSIGTVRMEAFIDDSLGRDAESRLTSGQISPRFVRPRGNSQWSWSTQGAC